MSASKASKTFWLVLLLVLAAAAAGVGILAPWKKRTAETSIAVHEVKRGDLRITVLESGSVKSLKSKEIKCEVEGQTQIIKLIPEGTFITEEDVKNQRVLVELNSAELRDKIIQEEITLQGAQASFTQAKESYDIQLNQNESNIKAGELAMKFAKMDLEKYLGADLMANVNESTVGNYSALTSDKTLGGEALQQLRKLRSDIDLADEEVKRATEKVGWTEKLKKEGFVTQNELDADKLALKRQIVSHEQAIASLDIFIRYEFPKQVERKLADYQEAVKELERIQARARSEIASKEAELMSNQAALRLKTERFARLQTQLKACVIYATSPGLIVYGTSDNPWQRTPPLEEGASVREKQVLITLPDTSAMAVEVKIHEAAIEKVVERQRARITLDAYPDLAFEGFVNRKAILPDAVNRWMNPDLKVYSTDVAIVGEHKMLKPGLSAEVEIYIDELKNVVSVPIQAVVPRGDKRLCYVVTPTGNVERTVETGMANDHVIEIKTGLEPGEKVLLSPPRYSVEQGSELLDEEPDAEEKKDEVIEEKQPLPVDVAPPVITEETTPAESENGTRGERRRPSAEELEKIRKELESLSPEEQQKMRERMRSEGREGGTREGGREGSTRRRPAEQSNGDR